MGHPPESTAVLVVGMHRTGTSALARVLNLHGADLGSNVAPADEHNPRGYWENLTIVEMHDRLLASLGTRWDALSPLPEGWRESPAGVAFAEELHRLVPRVFDPRRPLLVKDPRQALLLPPWIDALESLGRRPVFVLAVRHPDEVAASLARRDGLSPAWSRLLWLRYIVEAERATRGRPRVFVAYDRLLADWRREHARITAALELDWPSTDATIARQIDDFLDPELRHHRLDAQAGRATLPSPLREVYEEACAAAADVSPATFTIPALERWRALTLPVIAELEARVAGQRAGMARLVAAAGRPEFPDVKRLRSGLRYEVDEPHEGAVVSRRFRVAGWCFGPDGQSPTISVRAGSSRAAADERTRRDLAAAFPGQRGIIHSGFEATVDLPPGHQEFVVEACLGEGVWVPLATRRVHVGPVASPRRGGLRTAARLVRTVLGLGR